MQLARRTVDAIRFARDPLRVQYAPDVRLTEAALLIARAIVQLEEGRNRRPELAAQACAMLDGAGQAIADEMRRREGIACRQDEALPRATASG